MALWRPVFSPKLSVQTESEWVLRVEKSCTQIFQKIGQFSASGSHRRVPSILTHSTLTKCSAWIVNNNFNSGWMFIRRLTSVLITYQIDLRPTLLNQEPNAPKKQLTNKKQIEFKQARSMRRKSNAHSSGIRLIVLNHHLKLNSFNNTFWSIKRSQKKRFKKKIRRRNKTFFFSLTAARNESLIIWSWNETIPFWAIARSHTVCQPTNRKPM